MKIKQEDGLPRHPDDLPDDPFNLETEVVERLVMAGELREKGNQAFQAKDYPSALRRYSHAIM